MKTNTWMVVMAALAVTGSMVIAKSFLPAPQVAEADPQSRTTPIYRVQAGVGDEIVEPALSAPAMEGPADAPEAPSMTVDAGAARTTEAAWTVLVVRGKDAHYVTYPSEHVKAQAP